MEKFIPYEKLSKKAQKEKNAKQRLDWGMVKPCTRVEKSKKDYSRKVKHKGSMYDDNGTST